MVINPLTVMPVTAGVMPGALEPTAAGFGKVMEKVARTQDEKQRRLEAEEAAAGLVSNALILPILKQIRRSTFNMEGPFSPGKGEKTFGPEFDIEMADRIAKSPNLGIRTALAQRLMKRS